MKTNPNYDRIEPELDEIPEEDFMSHDPIGLTFISGIHKNDLQSFVERAERLADDVY